MNRRQFIAAAGALAASSALPPQLHAKARSTTQPASTKPSTTQAALPDDLVWHDVRDWGLEGRAFNDTESYFDRLPARAKPIVRKEVWALSQNTAGMSTHFETDARDIYARYTLTSSMLAMPHMPASGVSGLDIYGQQDNNWHWLGGRRPAEQTSAGVLAKGITPGKRAYQVNLPLYNGVKSLEIGVPKDAAFSPIPPRKEKPILFYGTSITQGGCASRPGMAFVAILGRRLNRPMLNFGFSGNGRMEMEVGQFLMELEPAIFVIDCSANMTTELVAERTAPLVTSLRNQHKSMPILLVDERAMTNVKLQPQSAEMHKQKSDALKKAYDDLIQGGMTRVYLRNDENLLGTDGEGTVDGSHPTDLGMMRYADALEPDLRRILKGE